MDVNLKCILQFCLAAAMLCVSETMPLRRGRQLRQRKLLPVSDSERLFIEDQLLARGYTDEKHPPTFTLQRALRQFQEDKSLEVTGQFDKSTQEAMHEFRCGFNKNPGGALEIQTISEPTKQRVKRQSFRRRRGRRRLRKGKNKQATQAEASTRIQDSPQITIEFLARWWTECDLTWSILNDHALRDPADVRESVSRVFQIWGRALANSRERKLSFTETNDTDANIVLSFTPKQHGDSNAFDGPGGVLAHAFLPTVSRHLNGKLHWDTDEDWEQGALAGRLFYYITLHEIGHVLGMQHSNEFDAVMYPFIGSRHASRRSLTQDDINKLNDLYPKRWCENLFEVPTIVFSLLALQNA